jgi:hypothetical protein
MTEALFDGVDTTWGRVPNSAPIAEKVKQLLATFSSVDPAASVPGLLDLRKELTKDVKNDWLRPRLAKLTHSSRAASL